MCLSDRESEPPAVSLPHRAAMSSSYSSICCSAGDWLKLQTPRRTFSIQFKKKQTGFLCHVLLKMLKILSLPCVQTNARASPTVRFSFSLFSLILFHFGYISCCHSVAHCDFGVLCYAFGCLVDTLVEFVDMDLHYCRWTSGSMGVVTPIVYSDLNQLISL